jgi:deoxyribose-phosphate aldolase
MRKTESFIELQLIHPTVSIAEMYKALSLIQKPGLAGLVIPPFWVKKLRRDWGDDNTSALGTVIGFPHGYQRTEVKQLETEIALHDGATDIEVMLNTSAWFSAQNNWVKIEFAKLGKLIHQHEAFFTIAIEARHFDRPNLQKVIKEATDAGVDYIKIYQAFNFSQTIQIKQLIPDTVGLKIVADGATHEERQQLIDAGIERICLCAIQDLTDFNS